MNNITPVILCGGSGTRLWPLSRGQRPKQFIPLLGKTSLFMSTLGRVSSRYGFAAPMLLANDQYRFLAEEQAALAGVEIDSLILEPVGRNTAPAVLSAALLKAKAGRAEDLLLFLPSDHMIMDIAAFHQVVEKGAAYAAEGNFVCFGIEARSPETGYGYVLAGEEKGEGAYLVDKFVEKPDLTTAEGYVAHGGYSWNSGMFLFKAQAVLDAFARFNPEMLKAVSGAVDAGYEDLDFFRLGEEEFAASPADSVDYALMERIDNAIVIPADMGWSDVGSYSALWEAGEKDENDNVVIGDVNLVNSTGCYVRSLRGNVSVLGAKDLVVVRTGDVTLVADKHADQDVKVLLNQMKAEGRKEVTEPPRVYRPWGNYKSLVEEKGYQVKEIVVKPGRRLSLQSHKFRSEHWVVVRGEAVVTRDDDEFLLKEDESVYLPVGCRHRLENKTDAPLKLIEVQTGSYLGEDDIVRYDDDFGRKGTTT